MKICRIHFYCDMMKLQHEFHRDAFDYEAYNIEWMFNTVDYICKILLKPSIFHSFPPRIYNILSYRHSVTQITSFLRLLNYLNKKK